MRRRIKVKSVKISAHPSLYEAMEELGRKFKDKNGMGLSQVESTKIIAEHIRKINIPDIFNLRGRKCF